MHTLKCSAHTDSGKQACGTGSYLVWQDLVLRIWYCLVEQADPLTTFRRLTSHPSVQQPTDYSCRLCVYVCLCAKTVCRWLACLREKVCPKNFACSWLCKKLRQSVMEMLLLLARSHWELSLVPVSSERVGRQKLQGIFHFLVLLKYFLLQPCDSKSRFATLATSFKKQRLWPLTADRWTSTNSADWLKKILKSIEAGCYSCLYSRSESICSHAAGINTVSSAWLVW